MPLRLEGLVIPVNFDTGLLFEGLDLIKDTLAGFVTDTIDWGNSLDEVQDSLGGTSKEAAGLALAAEKIGMPIEGAVGLINKMVKGLTDAKGGLGATGKLLDSMGIDVLDANGAIRPFNQLIGDVASKIAVMPDGLEKTNLEMQLFGRSGAEAGDLMAQLANGGMQNAIDQADRMGLAIDPAMVKEFEASWATLQMTLEGFGIQIGAKVLPVIQTVIDKIVDFGSRPEVQAFVDGALENLGKFTDWITNTGIPAIVDFAENAKLKFEDFKNSSATESAAIGVHWDSLLGHIGELMDSVFGTKGINLIIDWKAIGISAMQAIDLALYTLDISVQGWIMLIDKARLGWEIIRSTIREVLDLIAQLGDGSLILQAEQAIIGGGAPGAHSGAAAAAGLPQPGIEQWDMNEFIVKLAGELAKVVPQ